MGDEAREAVDFLRAHHVVSLSLVNGGAPHACSLMYATDGCEICWLSDPSALHSRLVDARPGVEAAATVAPDYEDYRHIRGLQIFGKAARVDGIAAKGRAMAWLLGRYGFLASAAQAPALSLALAKAVPYRLVPDRVVFVDNRRSFGSKATVSGGELAAAARAGRG